MMPYILVATWRFTRKTGENDFTSFSHCRGECFCLISVNSWHCNRHTTTPNDPPNSSQLEPSHSQLRWSWLSIRFATSLVSRERSATQAILPPTWLELDGVGLNLIKLKFSPNSSQVSTVWPPQSTQANSRQVGLLLLCRDYAVVFRQYWIVSCKLARLGGIVWPL